EVEQQCADEGAEGGPHDGRDEGDLPARGREAGEGQDHLARDRREEVLRGDRETGTGCSEHLHQLQRQTREAVEFVGGGLCEGVCEVHIRNAMSDESAGRCGFPPTSRRSGCGFPQSCRIPVYPPDSKWMNYPGSAV